MTAGRPLRIRRQNMDGEHLGIPNHPSCHACYRPLEHPKATYCSPRCHHAHKRLRGAA